MLPLVLYTAETPWESHRTLTELLGEPAVFHGFAPAWQPLFWNLANRSAAALLASGEAWLQALAVLRAEGEEKEAFETVYREALRQLESLHGRDHVRWYDLMRIILTWAAWRRPKAERQGLLSVPELSQAQLPIRQEVQSMTETIAEALIAEGLAEGLAKGRAEGRSEGELLNSRKMLRRLLEDRFGALPEVLNQRIEAATDLQRLEAAVLQVYHIQKLDDLQL